MGSSVSRSHRPPFTRRSYAVLARISPGCPPLTGRFPCFTHPSATLLAPKCFRVRLACVKHAASVQSEPGSNSSVQSSSRASLKTPIHCRLELLPSTQCSFFHYPSAHTSYLFFVLKELLSPHQHLVGEQAIIAQQPPMSTTNRRSFHLPTLPASQAGALYAPITACQLLNTSPPNTNNNHSDQQQQQQQTIDHALTG